jgi:hypothetical protein
MKLQLGLTLEPDLSCIPSLLIEFVKVRLGFDASLPQVRFSLAWRFHLHARCDRGALVLVGEDVHDF